MSRTYLVLLDRQFEHESLVSEAIYIQPGASLILWDPVIHQGPLSTNIPALNHKPLKGRGYVSLHFHHLA